LWVHKARDKTLARCRPRAAPFFASQESTPMNFSYSEEQNLLRDSVRKWVKGNYEFEARRKQLREHGGFAPAHWQQMAELGWLALPFSEADGGLGGSLLDVTILMEEFGKGLVVEPYLANVVLAGGAIRLAGSAHQRAALLPVIADGSRQAALAFAELQGRYALNDVCTQARRDGDGWVLDGSKIAVLNGDAAHTLVVAARTGGAQWSMPALLACSGKLGRRLTVFARPKSPSRVSGSVPTPCLAKRAALSPRSSA
jgi:alkylation response protein AidB-like acyl-CoA dehydrogenase